MARLRQAVIAASDLDHAVRRLRDELGLGEPYADPGVSYFGLRNAVFGLGDTFLEVISPARPDTSAGRLLARRGGDCGYMAMFQVDDLGAARARARTAGVREVFEVELDDISEVHLHPADMQAAIVSLSAARPASSWRWGGPDWERRAAGGGLDGIAVAVPDPEGVAERWRTVIGEPVGVEFVAEPGEAGLIEIRLRGDVDAVVELGTVRLVMAR